MATTERIFWTSDANAVQTGAACGTVQRRSQRTPETAAGPKRRPASEDNRRFFSDRFQDLEPPAARDTGMSEKPPTQPHNFQYDNAWRTTAGLPRACLGSPEAANILKTVLAAGLIAAAGALLAAVALAKHLPPQTTTALHAMTGKTILGRIAGLIAAGHRPLAWDAISPEHAKELRHLHARDPLDHAGPVPSKSEKERTMCPDHTITEPKIVQLTSANARELADILQTASPARARDFARAMHERACAQQDDAGCNLWAQVMSMLPDMTFPKNPRLIQASPMPIRHPRPTQPTPGAQGDTMSTPAAIQGIRFGAFTLVAARDTLVGPEGDEIALRRKTFELLAYFVERPGRVVTRTELLDALWPGVTVADEAVTQCVSEIRAAIGKDGPHLLRTVPKRGYLLDAPVMPVSGPYPSQVPGPDRAAALARLAEGKQLRFGETQTRANLLAQRDLFRQATELDPELVDGWVFLAFAHGDLAGNGLSLNRAADLAAGAAAAERAAALAPQDSNVHSALGGILREDPDRIEEALAAYRRAVLLTPSAHPSRANVGLMLILLGRAEEARAPISTSIAAVPDHRFRWGWEFYLGVIDLLLGEGDHGSTRLGEAIGGRPGGLEVEQVMLLFAASLAANGKTGEARTIVAEALRRNPDLTCQSMRDRPLWPTRNPIFLAQQAGLADRLAQVGLP
eukprot:gene6021-6094_t